MALFYKVNGNWKKCDVHYKTTNGWKEVKNVYHKVGTVWKPIWSYFWETGAWSTCSAPCGGGTQTRTTTCKRSDGFYKADSLCTSEGLTKPILEQVCNTHSCQLTLPNIHISTPRNVTYNQRILRHTFNESTIHSTTLRIGSLTVSDTCKRTYGMAVVVNGVYIYKVTYGSVFPTALVNQTTSASVCSNWSTRAVLSNRIIQIPASVRIVGSKLEFHIYMAGGSDCCKGMNITNLLLS